MHAFIRLNCVFFYPLSLFHSLSIHLPPSDCSAFYFIFYGCTMPEATVIIPRRYIEYFRCTLINPIWLLESSPFAFIIGCHFCATRYVWAERQRRCWIFHDHLSIWFWMLKPTQMLNPNTLPLSNRLVYRRSSSNQSSRCCRRMRIKSRKTSHLSKNERFLLLSWTKTNSRNDVRLDAHACSPQGLVAHLLRRQRRNVLAEQNRFSFDSIAMAEYAAAE